MTKSGRLKVFVPMRDDHDYKAAEEYGELVPITEGEVDQFSTHRLYQSILEKMQDATQNDMVLVTGLTLSNCIASAIMAHKFGAVSFLLFRRGEYLMRRVILPPRDDIDVTVAELPDD